jgi:DNA topoisomerase-6 subunit A
MLTLGNKSSKRYLFNVAHAKKFMQTLLVADFCKELQDRNKHTSVRDLYYAIKRTLPGSDENTFEEQRESDPIVVDLEVMLDMLREQLHLTADVRGRVVGNVVIKDRGDTIDWSKLGSGGWAIPSSVEEITIKSVDAKYILVIEKNAAFERLHEDKFWKKQNCILVTTQGQAARGPRRLIQRLSTDYKLPVYVFTDADSYGWYIYSVIKYGSISLAHISERLGCPNAKFIGLTISDIDEFDLKNFTIKAKEVDIKRARELLKYDWFKHPAWQKELKLMIQRKIKAELEALSGRGLEFMTEVYLPTKIKKKKFLP